MVKNEVIFGSGKNRDEKINLFYTVSLPGIVKYSFPSLFHPRKVHISELCIFECIRF